VSMDLNELATSRQSGDDELGRTSRGSQAWPSREDGTPTRQGLRGQLRRVRACSLVQVKLTLSNCAQYNSEGRVRLCSLWKYDRLRANIPHSHVPYDLVAEVCVSYRRRTGRCEYTKPIATRIEDF